ncbi:MAG: PH domain-containing protein [Acidobacteria bacterium]|nr:PH domain-containing protein [Acidobacteriota bacterium]
MFCNQCGAQLNDGSRFCNKCGATLGAGANVQPPPSGYGQGQGVAQSGGALNSIADEHNIFTIRPTMIFVLVWYAMAALLVIGVAALLGILNNSLLKNLNGWVILFTLVGAALLIFSIPIYKHIVRRREVYTLTNHKLDMRYGIIAKTVRHIPLSKIQDVTVKASVWQRLLKLGDIEIDSASETGKIILDEIHNPEYYANVILSELRRLK